ncbi:MAG: rod shape-determining protein MreD [Rubrobacteraceae bacterium]
MQQTSIVRAAVVVALAAVMEVVLGPYLELGWLAPKFLILGVVFAVPALRDLQAVLLGFFAGVLFDSLSGGLFGVGSIGGLVAATLTVRANAVRRKGSERFIMAQVVGASVAVYDLVNWTATGLAGLEAPPFGVFLVGGILPDALLNGLLAYLIGGWLLKITRPKTRSWDTPR